MTNQRNSSSKSVRLFSLTKLFGIFGRVLLIAVFATSSLGITPALAQTDAPAESPTIATVGTLTEFSSLVGSLSAEQSYTVSASALSAELVITAPEGFEISKISGGEFASSLFLAPDEKGKVADTTIYVHFKPTSGGVTTTAIIHTSANASQVDLAVSGSASDPTPVATETATVTATETATATATEESLEVSGLAALSSEEGALSLALPPATWTAYNDCSGTNSITNTTNILGISGTGTLKNFTTGATLTGITATFASSGSPTQQTGNGAATNAGTDAYTIFNGKADMVGVVNYGSSGGWYIDLTISGLDTTKTYSFVTTANRADSSYTTRISRYTISDITSAANASSSGVTVISNESVSFVTGYNTANGYVASWTGIQPGTDGDFKVRADYPSNYQAYGMSVFMLAEEDSTSPSITTSGTLSAFAAATGTYSAEQSYTVSASNLTSNLVIAPPAGFEISETSGGTFIANPGTLTISPTAGVVSARPIYVRFRNDTAGTLSGNITHNSTGATEQTIAVSGTAGTPTITVTSSMTAFTQSLGSPSAEKTYTISGTYLKGDITVTAPANFQISKTTGGTFASSQTFSPTNGTLATTTVYVRLNRPSVGSSSGDITHVSTDALTQNLAVSGTTTNETCVSSRISVSADDAEQRNDTNAVDLDGDTSTHSLQMFRTYSGGSTGTLNWWGLRFLSVNVPQGATITSATVTFRANADNATASGMTLWGQLATGPATFAASTNNITSRARTTATTTWTVPAWTIGSDYSTPSLTSIVQEIVNQSGWVANNAMVVIGQTTVSQNKSAISRDSTDGSTLAPILNVCYSLVSIPTITTAGTLTAFSAVPGSPSAAQTYTVSGSNLTTGISITAPEGFEISDDGSTYHPTLTIPQTDGSASDTISVRLAISSVEAEFDGDITHTSGEADQVDVAVTGSVKYQYTLSAGNDGHGSVTLNPAGGVYASGTTVTLTTVANTGYRFSSWSGTNSGDVINTSGVYTIIMNGNKSIQANFAAIPQYTLTTSVSPSDGGSITLNPTGGTYYENTVVTVTAAADSGFEFKEWAGDLSGTTNPTTINMNGNKIVEAIFEPAETCSTVNLVPSADLYLSGYSTSTNNNYGVSDPLKVTLNTSSPRGDLFQWDLSSIPSSATITSASLTLNVTTGASATYNLYNMRRAWVEGSGSGDETEDGATWGTYDGSNSWEANGAAGTTFDRYNINLWGAGTSSFNSAGSKTVAFNSNGVEVIQGWVNGTVTNFGLTMQNYASSSTEYTMQFNSSENGTLANRPKLNVTYCVPTADYTLTVGNDGHGTVTIDPVQATYAYGTVVTITPVPAAGYEFGSWGGADAEDPIENGGDSWLITMDSNKSIVANFSLLPINVPPNQPVLVQPADDATGVSNSPTLEVTVSDGNTTDTSLDVSFYGRPVGGSAGDDFTLIAIPDTQNEAQYYSTVMSTQLQWIANQMSTDNIVFATGLGDIVNTASSTTQWNNAVTAYNHLETGNVPYSVGPGNHDLGGLYETYFGVSRFSGKSWYQGHYGSDNFNNYSFFSASGNDFILINLQFSPSTAVLDWADALLKANPGRRGIIEQHDLLNINNTWYNQTSYNALRDNPNLFLMLCGHMHSSSDGSAYVAGSGTDGHTIHVLQTDYQDYPNGGNGYLRILRFSPADDKIYAEVYSPSLDAYLANTSNYEQMEMVYDLSNGSTGAYTLLGTDEDVANGANATFNWSGRSASTQYEWYATVTDGSETTTGSTWSFTTGSGANTAPVLAAIGSKSVNELVNLAFTATASDDGLPSGTLSYSLDAGTSGAIPSGASINSSTGAFTWTPTEAQGPAAYTFDVVVSDGSLSDKETITVTVNEVNVAPTNIALSASSVIENAAINTVVGLLSSTDADNGNTFTYTLVGGDTSAFNISGSNLRTSAAFDYETKSSYSVTVRTTDQGGLYYEKALTITVTNANEAPTNIALSASSVVENAAINTVVGTLTTTDPDASDTTTYTLVGGDTSAFNISGSSLRTSAAFDYETKASYSVTIRSTDGGGLYYEKSFTITVTNVNETPTDIGLSDGNIPENAGANTEVGTLSTIDPDAGNTFTYTLVTGDGSTDNGSFNISGTSLRATASLNFESKSSYTIRVRSADQGGLFVEESFTISVTNVNESPNDISLSSISVAENLPVGTTVASITSTDYDGADSAVYSFVSGQGYDGANAMFTIDGSTLKTAEIFNYESQTTYSILIRATDGGGLTYTEAFTITITNVNEAPVVTGESFTLDEDEDKTFTVAQLLGNDNDPDGDTLDITALSNPVNILSLGFSYPDINYESIFNYNGPASFDYTVSDGHGGTATGTVTITVTAVNDPPTLMSPIGNKTINEGSELIFAALGVDVDNTALTYSLKNGTGGSVPAGAIINTDETYTAYFSWTPTEEQGAGSYTFDVCVNDGYVDVCETITVTVNEVNVAPVLATIGTKSGVIGVQITFNAVGSDIDLPSNNLTYSLEDEPAGALINATTGAFTWTPTAAGSYEVTVKVCDNGSPSACDEEKITINVSVDNSAPTDITLSNSSVDENKIEGSLVGSLTSTDPDTSDTFTYSLVTGTGDTDNGYFTITGGSLLTNAVFNYEADHSYAIRIRTTDGGGLYYEEPFTITIVDVNDAPVLNTITAGTATEHTLLTFTATATDDDVPADTKTFNLTGAPSGATIDATTGIFTWTPAENQGGAAYSFDVCVSDGEASDCKTISGTVVETNTAPVLNTITAGTATEHALLTFTATATDEDVPEDTKTFSLTGAPSGATIDATTGIFTWTPAENQGGVDYSFGVCVSDGEASDCKTISGTVVETNTAPVLSTITAGTASEHALLTFTATATDEDVPADTKTYSLTGAPSGATIDATTGIFTWTPAENQGGTEYSFGVCVSDGEANDCKTISGTVVETNTAPVLTTIGDKSGVMGVQVTFTVAGSDSDLPSNNLTFSLEDEPVGALINATTGAFTWTPTVVGSYEVTVNVCDDFSPSACDEEKITINVSADNFEPTDITLSNNNVEENKSVGTLVGSLTTTDPDAGDTFTYTLVSGSGSTDNGSFTITGSSLLTGIGFNYEADHSYDIRIRTTDGGGLYYEEPFTITIVDVNDAPVLTEITAGTASELSELTFTAAVTDEDVPADTKTFSLTGAPSGATIGATSGIFSWIPAENQGGAAYSFDVCVSDGEANDCQTLSGTVVETNTAPVISEGATVTVEMSKNGTPTAFALTLHATDTDLPTNTLTWSISSAALHGTAGASSTGTSKVITFTPFTDFTGTDTFVVQVSDGALTDTINVTVNITTVTYQVSVTLSGTGDVTVTSNPAGISCASGTCSASFEYGASVTLTATPASAYYRLKNWSGDCTGTGTCSLAVTSAKAVTANIETATFTDVPFTHPRWAYIEELYNRGYTKGCQATGEPLKFCPETTMIRAESAVFMVRGSLGAIETPTDTAPNVFGDDWTEIPWAPGWAEKMWDLGMTAGCQYPADSSPKMFCPYSLFTREMGAVFALRIKHGSDMPVPEGQGDVFEDMTDTDPVTGWGTGWAEKAVEEGLIPACSYEIDGTTPKEFCPQGQLDRSWSAYMIVKAKGWAIPE